MGHVRDLPKKTLGIDVEDDFRPEYVDLRDRSAALAKLRKAAAKADTVYIATDPDREGEAIAWHLGEALKLEKPRRIEFNEITRRAVTEALKHPREIDMRRVDAQQARRLLDRLVGYTLSPLLQRKMGKFPLSAGRVQSVAVRLICEREREIQAFVPEEFWEVIAQVTPGAMDDIFSVKLVTVDGKKAKVENCEQASAIANEIWESALRVSRVKESQQARRPPPPFITSTLQQEAANRVGMSARHTMRVAQQLYEGVELGPEGSVGLITYMRTDSTRIAQEAQADARKTIVSLYGEEYLPKEARKYAARRGAQEAHEAVRPTSPARTPDAVAPYLSAQQKRLYGLIWSRFLASQMADLRLRINSVDVRAGRCVLRGRGVEVLFPGFSRVYPTRDKEVRVPRVEEGALLDPLSLSAAQRFTQPPPRYTEGTLVRALEAEGIGRPSTYAPIISTIQDRGYVYLEEKRFRPTDLGFAVTDQLVAHFPEVINVAFTADMESKLDRVEEGDVDWVSTLREFYGPFSGMVSRAEKEMGTVKVQPQETDEVCEQCGKPMLLRVGRRGPFLACSGYPECDNTRPVPGQEGKEGEARAAPERTDEKCDKCGGEMVIRTGRRGRFLGCSKYPKCRNTRPLPGEEAAAPEPTDEKCDKCGSPMVIRTGRRGRFLACSAFPNCRNTRSLPGEEAAAPEPTDEKCELCGRPMALRQGRYGQFLGCTGYPECKGIKRLQPKDGAESGGESEGERASDS